MAQEKLELTIPKALFNALDCDEFIAVYDVDEIEPDPYDGSEDGDDSEALEATRGLAPPPPTGFEKSEAGIWVPRDEPSLPTMAKAQRVVPFARVLKLDVRRGPDALAVKRALRKAGHRGADARNSMFGPSAVGALKNFQRRKGLQVDGVYGRKSHAKLMPFFDSRGIFLMAKAQEQIKERKEKGDIPHGIQAQGLFQYNNRWVVRYTQGWRRMSTIRGNLRPPRIGHWEDCSSSYAAWCFIGGSPDPNGGTAYTGRGRSARPRSNPQGYTGTLINHGRRIGGHDMGAAILYGSSYSHTRHVAAGIGTSGKVVSFGSYPTRILWWNYRSDDLVWRVYWN